MTTPADLLTAKEPGDGVTVGATATQVLAANLSREHAVIANDSDETIYLALGPAAAMHKGIPLIASGGSYEIGRNNLYTGIVSAICASGGKNLCVSEVGGDAE